MPAVHKLQIDDPSDDVFVIQGGQPISGEIEPAGNKNEALPVVAATLLAAGASTLSNLPRIRDVLTLCEILASVGAELGTTADGEIRIDTSDVNDTPPDADLCGRIRGSFLLVPGLLHRTGSAVLPRPGGDRIGRRRMDTHLQALAQLGAEVKTHEARFELHLDGRFRGSEVFLDEASVMATDDLRWR